MAPDAPPRARLLNAAVVLATLALALGVVEIVLRVWLPVRGVIVAIDDRYLFQHVPESRRLAGAGDGSWPGVLVRINAAGRRGDESGLSRAARRVIVYGDSFIAAEDTPVDRTFAVSLERLLADRGVAVLNAGVTGYGPDQVALRLQDEAAALKPDVVIVALFAGNDFGDLLRNKLFRLDADGALARNAPVIADDLRRDFTAPLAWSSIQVVRAVQSGWQRWRARRAAAPPPVLDRTGTRLANRLAEYESYVVNGDNVVRNLIADEYDADVSLQPDSASARYRVRLMGQVVDRIRDLVEGVGARLLLLVIPEWCDVGGPCDEERAARRRFPGYRADGLTEALASVARDRGIDVVDLFEPFRSAGPSRLYYVADQHWNPAGQSLAARLTADRLGSAGWLGPAASPGRRPAR